MDSQLAKFLALTPEEQRVAMAALGNPKIAEVFGDLSPAGGKPAEPKEPVPVTGITKQQFSWQGTITALMVIIPFIANWLQKTPPVTTPPAPVVQVVTPDAKPSDKPSADTTPLLPRAKLTRVDE